MAEVSKLGSKVSAIIAPNLQHWLGCSSWASLFPKAMVYVAPEAEGECLLQKLGLENRYNGLLIYHTFNALFQCFRTGGVLKFSGGVFGLFT